MLQRWTQLFTGPLLGQRYLSGARAAMGESELEKVREMAEVYRARLLDLSWYMRVLNESLARQANAEDDCTGRFKSQALLDEQALLAAMAYVDLNPVRAGMADTPEASDYTSIQERLGCAPAPLVQASAPDPLASLDAAAALPPPAAAPLPQAPLMPFDATGRTPWAVPFGWHDYAELVDWTGRLVHPHKKGCMAQGSAALLARLGVEAEAFIVMASTFLQGFGSAVGTPAQMAQLCARR